MPEIKNNFLQGKMNKDLDDRILPNGQYRDAQNISVSKSEDSDVGTVQNIKGNALHYGTALNLGSTFETIGHYADPLTGDIFWFVTDFNPDDNNFNDETSKVSYAPTCGTGATSRIYYANANSQTNPVIIVQSHRLNFSQKHRITHVNRIDDLLFWTDNYNQPRRINIKAVPDINDLKDYYSDDIYLEDKISVAQYSPYSAPEVSMSYDSTIKSKHIEEEFVKFAYRFKFANNEYSVISPFSQHCFQPGSSSDSFNTGAYGSGDAGLLTDTELADIAKNTTVDSMINKANKVTLLIDLPFTEKVDIGSAKVNDAAGISGTGSHTIDSKDGTISNGHMLVTANNEFYPITGGNFNTTIETTESISPAIPDNTDLYFYDITTTGQYGWTNKLNIKEIEILYTESDSAAIRIVDKIKIDLSTDIKLTLEVISATKAKLNYAVEYVYKSTKPTRTLPEAEIVRVADVIPLKAHAQEISGNRVIYGNFLQNKNLDIINNNTKFSITNGDQAEANKQYLLSSVKSNRTYQVGIVLSDRFGRQSPVILPEDSTTFVEPQGASTVVTNGTSSWTHTCLKATFTEAFSSDELYDADTNPLGWYSYRMVVKQTEQEYYNVYCPQVIQAGRPTNLSDERSFLVLTGDNINKVPRDVTDRSAETGLQGSDARLLPKITDNNILHSNQFESLVRLTGDDFIDVISIGTARDQGVTDDIDAGFNRNVLTEVYLAEKNPLLAELPDGYGNGWQTWKSGSHKFSFYVFETYPFVSVIDIYYESSTGGLLKDLNEQINASLSNVPAAITLTEPGTKTFLESIAATPAVNLATLAAQDGSGNSVTSTFTINSVTDGLGADRSGDGLFQISGTNLQQANTFEFKNTAADTYNISITATKSGASDSFTATKSITLGNVNPSINVGTTNDNTDKVSNPTTIAAVASGNSIGVTITGKNGSAKTSAQQNNLTFSIVSQTNSGRYTINSTTGVISAGVTLSNGMSDTLTLKTTDVANADSPDTDLKINVTGSPYTQFWRSDNGFYDSTDADNFGTIDDEYTDIRAWHDGSSDLPEVNDVVYTNADGSTVFNSDSYWHSMCGPDPCSAGTALYVFKTNSSGVVTHVTLGNN